VTFQEFVEAVKKAADVGLEESAPAFHINPETYRLWKANTGNAKARRRWRRRDIPNTQRASGRDARRIAYTMPGGEVLTLVGDSRVPPGTIVALDGGTWGDGSTWVPGIWAGTVPRASAGAMGEPTMRVADVDREARTITLEHLP
jgi:hypothetical protein